MQITYYKSNEEIVSIVEGIKQKKMKTGSHGFEEFGNLSIYEASINSAKNYTNKAQNRPAISLMEVVLAANRNYNRMVKSRVKLIEESGINSINELYGLMESISMDDFFNYWNTKDEKKYNTLKSLVITFKEIIKICKEPTSEFDCLNEWAKNVDLRDLSNDPIWRVRNIGIATLQHLRMVFGANTIKPDQRVKEVLMYEFGIKRLSDLNAIVLVEQISEIVKEKALTVDQIFVKYGSGYYNKANNKLSIKDVARRLLEQGISKNIISSVTDLSLNQINNLNKKEF